MVHLVCVHSLPDITYFDVNILIFHWQRWLVFFCILFVFVLLKFLCEPHIMLLLLHVSYLDVVRLWKILIDSSNSRA